MTHAAILIFFLALAFTVLIYAIKQLRRGGSERANPDSPLKAHSAPQIRESGSEVHWDPDDYKGLSQAKFEDFEDEADWEGDLTSAQMARVRGK